MSKFQVGDRVRVYENAESILSGSVADLGGGKVRVLIEPHGALWVFHPKQCRKLVRRERRRVFISERLLKKLGTACVSDAEFNVSLSRCVSDDVEFVEVRRGKT